MRTIRDEDRNGDEGVSLGSAEVAHETDLALLVSLDGSDPRGGNGLWIPKSVIHEDSEVYDAREGREGELVVKRWWAEKQGLA